MKQLLVSCGVLALAAGCTKVEGTSTTRGSGKVVEQRLPSGIEKLVLDLESCSLEGYQITATCPAMEKLATELKQPGTARELSVALGRKLLAHHAAPVRIEASLLLGTDPSSRDAIVDAARYERDVHVREAMIRVVAADGARYPRVGAFLLEMTQFPLPEIRTQALAALTLPASRALPGAALRVLAMAEHDPVPSLRQAACAAGGKLGDPVVLPVYERLTATADDADLYAACLEGLVAMFHNEPAFDTASEGAYHLFLHRIQTQPAQAPWQVMSAFCNDDPNAHRPAWFDAHEVTAALRAVVAERGASWQARSAAIESMVGLGASKTELTALAQGYTARDGSDKVVLDKLLAESDRL